MSTSKAVRPVYPEIAHPEIVSLENFYPIVEHVAFAKDNGDIAIVVQPDCCFVYRRNEK
jgi:hypothetical protein